MKRFLLFLIVLITGFSGCSNKKNTSRKPVTNIQITPSNKIVSHGNEISLTISAKLFKNKLDKIELFIDGNLIQTSEKEEFSMVLNTSDFLVGNHQITCKTHNKSGKMGLNYASFLIVSDIKPKQASFELIETLPHNTSYFTQGLEFYNNLLYEGTGNYGTSKIIAYNPENEIIKNEINIENRYFGEGISVLNNKLYQLTYKSKKGFIYDVSSLEKQGEFTFQSNEGWGLANNGTYLIMSDGSSKIHFIDPATFKYIKSIEVCDNNGPISNINELEYANGFIYANIWMTTSILKINPDNGKVLSIYNLRSLVNYIGNSNVDVFNGIAYNPQNKLFYVTGKYWPNIFKVKLN